MKKLFITTLITLSTTSAFAFDVNLSEHGSMQVNKLVEIGAESVSCENLKARCVINGRGIGAQQPGQSLDEVNLTYFTTFSDAVRNLSQLKESGLCD